MRGISEESLRELFSHDFLRDCSVEYLIDCIGHRCQELNQWQPIESAPKDRTILAVVNGKTRLVRWGKTSHVPMYGFCLADQGTEDFDICRPSVWQELPDPPK